MIYKKNVEKIYLLFLFSHLIIWTAIPTFSNVNLPLDTIEALAWGSNLDWGYYKHPPLSAFFVEIFYKLFGSQDWAFYLLSQIFIIAAFIAIFKLSFELLEDKVLALISILLLESIFFYNFTTPEFNVNISQIPFWALSLYFAWKCIKFNNYIHFILLGIFFGLGLLSKYLFVYLIFGIKFLFLYFCFKEKKIDFINILITGLIMLIILIPHLIWLVENNFSTIVYALKRTGGVGTFKDHIIFPFTFIIKQIGILIPFFIMSFFLSNKFSFKNFSKNKKMIFLYFTVLIPIILMILTSLIMGAKIRTMWMTPFYLALGTITILSIKKSINLKKIQKLYYIFSFLFILSPATYLSISLLDDEKRTDYPGKEISRLVQNKWNDNFTNEIKIVVGDEWSAGNLSYHLNSRPIWTNDLKKNLINLRNDQGVIYTGNPKILKKVCPGVFGTIRPVGYCMIGKK